MSALKHNKVPEFFFGQLDFLLKYRPNASALRNEAYLIYSHNKTKEWLDNLDDKTKEQYLNDNRREGKKKAKTVLELTNQVLELIEQSKQGDTVEVSQEGDMPVLIGKNINHQFEDGVYKGKVVSVVPGFRKWYNVKYEDDSAIYVYQLYEDYRNESLEIVVEGLQDCWKSDLGTVTGHWCVHFIFIILEIKVE
ncbi:unnamed protein product [Mytilus edulis]|uniref:Uncharacterized protein n=1 Tax=Mytilus edulis TaxID=6550 RepID=A0A8S3VKT8_MYTED|nr:unnamed protein product [Mytilus edulis]